MFTITQENLIDSGKTVAITKYREPCYELYHDHDFFEIEYVISGIGMNIVGGKSIPAKPGDVFFVNFDAAHCFKSIDADNPVIVYNCIFLPDFFDNIKIDYNSLFDVSCEMLYLKLFPTEMKNVPFLVLHDSNGTVKKLLDDMHKTENKEELLPVLLTELCRLHGNSISDGCKDIKLAVSYIEENYKKQISALELSRLVFLSPNYFCAKFKEVTGLSVGEYIRKRRLDEVRRLLRKTDKPFETIAHEMGYENPAFLRSLFKKEMGMTPSEYRIFKFNKE